MNDLEERLGELYKRAHEIEAKLDAVPVYVPKPVRSKDKPLARVNKPVEPTVYSSPLETCVQDSKPSRVFWWPGLYISTFIAEASYVAFTNYSGTVSQIVGWVAGALSLHAIYTAFTEKHSSIPDEEFSFPPKSSMDAGFIAFGGSVSSFYWAFHSENFRTPLLLMGGATCVYGLLKLKK